MFSFSIDALLGLALFAACCSMPTAPKPLALDFGKGGVVDWRSLNDDVMGGRSRCTVNYSRSSLTWEGRVSLENNGGFIQITLDLDTHELLDASDWDGLEIDVFGNGEQYNLHLRTDAVRRPWQSYRQSFSATRTWQRIRLPFAGFAALLG